MIVIVDYGAGNVKSISNILDSLNAEYKISSNSEEILSAEAVIFPGQGHFGQAISNLEQKGLKDTIIKVIKENKTKFLGICLGLQILFEESEEAPNCVGLSVLKGKVKKFPPGKIPQIGWNNIETTNNNSLLEDDYFYFVNSFYVEPQEESVIASYCEYNGVRFCSSVQKENITAVQFHPEKSADAGKSFFEKWINS